MGLRGWWIVWNGIGTPWSCFLDLEETLEKVNERFYYSIVNNYEGKKVGIGLHYLGRDWAGFVVRTFNKSSLLGWSTFSLLGHLVLETILVTRRVDSDRAKKFEGTPYLLLHYLFIFLVSKMSPFIYFLAHLKRKKLRIFKTKKCACLDQVVDCSYSFCKESKCYILSNNCTFRTS